MGPPRSVPGQYRNRLMLGALAAFLGATTLSCGGDGPMPPAPPPPPPPPPPPTAPVQVGTIPDQAVEVGETVSLDVSLYFTDPDGDALAYAASSSAANVVSVSVSGSTVTITGVTKGTAEVTVTASDPDGLSATQRFAATVPNRAPEPSGTIPDQTVQVGETATLDVSLYFADPDEDALMYAAASADASVATVSVSGSAVTIQGVSVGSATLTVTAHDPDGDGATQRAGIDVTTPGPDLGFTGVSPVSATLTPGDSVTFTFHLRNRGTIASDATAVRAMRSVNPTISARDSELESYSMASLAPSQETSFPITIVVETNSAPGTIYIGMCVDAVSEESNTRNNCSEGAELTVVQPSSARGLAGRGAPVRIRVSPPRESGRPAAPL
ncbi:MAG: Ig-like domain-containing protein [Gemmatimonadetes bacterium]|nr:Ig-like domain-containing protein [Candidatus Palauibacter rhopaloidicola]